MNTVRFIFGFFFLLMMRYLSDKIRFLHQKKKTWEMKRMLGDKKEEKGYRKNIG